MYTPSLEDESHALKQEAKLQSRKAFRTATPATKPPMAHVVQNHCTVLSSLPIFSARCFLQYPRHESGKPPSVRGHTHTEKSAATCCEIAGSEGKSLLASPPQSPQSRLCPPQSRVQVKRRQLSGCDKTFAEVPSFRRDIFEPFSQRQTTQSLINQTDNTSHYSELSAGTPRVDKQRLFAATCRERLLLLKLRAQATASKVANSLLSSESVITLYRQQIPRVSHIFRTEKYQENLVSFVAKPLSFSTEASIHFVCGETRPQVGNRLATCILGGRSYPAAILVNEVRETAVSSYRRSSLSLLAANSSGCLFGKAAHSPGFVPVWCLPEQESLESVEPPSCCCHCSAGQLYAYAVGVSSDWCSPASSRLPLVTRKVNCSQNQKKVTANISSTFCMLQGSTDSVCGFSTSSALFSDVTYARTVARVSIDLGVQRRETADKLRTNDKHYCFIDIDKCKHQLAP